jgi:hypothetical protein
LPTLTKISLLLSKSLADKIFSSSLTKALLIFTPLFLMSFLVSLFELAKPISTIKSFNDNLPSVKLTLINGRFSD